MSRADFSGHAYMNIRNQGISDQFCALQNTYGVPGGLVIYIPLPVHFTESIADVIDDIKVRVETIAKTNEPKDQSVYVLKDTEGLVKYVGRTNDPGRREYEHRHDPAHPWRAEYTMTVVATGLTLKEAMLCEQLLISVYTVNYLENMRREIAVRNMPGYRQYANALTELYTGYDADTLFEIMG